MLDKLIELQAKKGQFTNGGELFKACQSDKIFRQEIDSLSKYYLHRSPAGCSNCYMDAYIELINLNIDKVMAQEKSKYVLSHGVLLRDVVNGDIDKNMTVHNTTDELALYHLKTNPDSAKMFASLPEDWEKQVEEYEPKAPKQPRKPKAPKQPAVEQE
ncbi:MAG: hypothetical protein ACK5KP_05460 [Paludibacteraceae bacterium]